MYRCSLRERLPHKDILPDSHQQHTPTTQININIFCCTWEVLWARCLRDPLCGMARPWTFLYTREWADLPIHLGIASPCTFYDIDGNRQNCHGSMCSFRVCVRLTWVLLGVWSPQYSAPKLPLPRSECLFATHVKSPSLFATHDLSVSVHKSRTAPQPQCPRIAAVAPTQIEQQWCFTVNQITQRSIEQK